MTKANCLIFSLPENFERNTCLCNTSGMSFVSYIFFQSREKITDGLHSGRFHYGGGDETVPKRLEGCSIDMFPQMAKE